MCVPMNGRWMEISLGRTYSESTRRGTANSTTSETAMLAARIQRRSHTSTAAATHAAIASHCSGSAKFRST